MEEFYVENRYEHSDIDMFGKTLEQLLDLYQGDAGSAVSQLDDPKPLAEYVVELQVIAYEFTQLAQGFERQFEEEFEMVISQ